MLTFIGGGGFADVYRQKSTGLIVKKLKNEYLGDSAICSRFKREFEITKSLQDISGIIRVFDFDEKNLSYTMEEADYTLGVFIRDLRPSEEERISYVQEILQVFTKVHKRDVIHRDISPTNIFLLSGEIRVADFGLGKNLKAFHSHQTERTNSFGQFNYCAPEQLRLLRCGDKKSDVFALGKLINFIMTTDPSEPQHVFKLATEKATEERPIYRQADADKLLSCIEQTMQYRKEKCSKQEALAKISEDVLDVQVKLFLSKLTDEEICRMLVKRQTGFRRALIKYMEQGEKWAPVVVQAIENEFRHVCRRFEDNDPIVDFAYAILINVNFSSSVKELAAKILKYIADPNEVNRYYAQRKIESLKSRDLEDRIKEILFS